eukprot:SAG11_NODE_726_length_7512_cov_23.219479_2_plen_130_part_00
MTLAMSYKLFVRVTSWQIAMSGKQEATQVASIPHKRTAGGVGPPEVQPPPKKKKKPSIKKKARIQELERLLAAEKKQSSDLANQVSQLTEEVGIIRRDCADQHIVPLTEHDGLIVAQFLRTRNHHTDRH